MRLRCHNRSQLNDGEILGKQPQSAAFNPVHRRRLTTSSCQKGLKAMPPSFPLYSCARQLWLPCAGA